MNELSELLKRSKHKKIKIMNTNSIFNKILDLYYEVWNKLSTLKPIILIS